VNRLESKTIEHNGITTSYYDEGQGSVLLMLHGFTGSKLDFHDQLSWFTDSYRVIVPDIRGHGESTNLEEEEGYSLQHLVDDLSSFIETMGLRDIHLLGHSMGGMVVIRYALANAGKLSSLILMDTSSAPLKMPEGMREMFRATIAKEGISGLIKLMRSAPKTDEVQNGIDYLGEQEHWLRVEEKLGQMDLLAYRKLGMELGTSNDLTATLSELEYPTTIMVGEADVPFVQPSRAMANVIRGAKLKIIPGAAHCPQYENAGAWREVIDCHLREMASS
jgi:pimeloyl-ACP methyl ester carboxylesterase